MDRLKKYDAQTRALDRKIVKLLEKRMNIVGEAAAYKWRYGLATPKAKTEERVIEKAASLACEIDLVEYSEGLIQFMEDIALKYETKVFRELDWKKKHMGR